MPILPLAALAACIAQVLVATFLAILFLQSSLDKILDRRGNLEYLTGHFAKSPLASTVKPMFVLVTLLELAAGLLSGIGAIVILVTRDPTLAFWGAAVACLTLTCLFFGQRVAKDYAGAATLVPYFILALLGMWVQAGPVFAS